MEEPECNDFVVREDGGLESALLARIWLRETFGILKGGKQVMENFMHTTLFVKSSSHFIGGLK